MSLLVPNALLFLHLLIALVTMTAAKVSAISIGFLLVSLVTNRVYLEEECLPSFEVLNCLLNLAASCLDNEIPLKEIASFSVMRFSLPSIHLIVLHIFVISVLWSKFSTKSLHFCRLCPHMRFWMSLFSLGSSGEVMSLLRRSSRLIITSSISAGTGSSWTLCRPVGCGAMLLRVELYEGSSHLFGGMLEVNACSRRSPPRVLSVPVGLL